MHYDTYKEDQIDQENGVFERIHKESHLSKSNIQKLMINGRKISFFRTKSKMTRIV